MEILLQNVTVSVGSPRRPLFTIGHFQIPSGSSLLIHGPSGIGKTSLLHLIAGLYQPDSGSVTVGGMVLGELTDRERALLRRRQLGIVFQRLNLLEHLTVLENVMLPLVQEPTVRERALAALEKTGLGALAQERAGVLSLGEQQRTAVARVLAASPALILADEPTSSLDERNAGNVLDLLQGISHGRTLVVASHDRRIEGRFTSVVDFSEVTAS